MNESRQTDTLSPPSNRQVLKPAFRMHSAKLVEGACERRTPADHYRQTASYVAKLTFLNKQVMDSGRRILEKPFGGRSAPMGANLLGILLNRQGAAEAIKAGDPSGWSIQTAESAVDPASRFMVDRGLNPEDWIEVPSGRRSTSKLTTCAKQWETVFKGIQKSQRVGDAPKVRSDIRILIFGSRNPFMSNYAFQVIAAFAADVHLMRAAIVLNDRSVTIVEGSSTIQDFLGEIAAAIKRLDPDVLVNYGARYANCLLYRLNKSRPYT